jgi:hypothetical protein
MGGGCLLMRYRQSRLVTRGYGDRTERKAWFGARVERLIVRKLLALGEYESIPI